MVRLELALEGVDARARRLDGLLVLLGLQERDQRLQVGGHAREQRRVRVVQLRDVDEVAHRRRVLDAPRLLDAHALARAEERRDLRDRLLHLRLVRDRLLHRLLDGGVVDSFNAHGKPPFVSLKILFYLSAIRAFNSAPFALKRRPASVSGAYCSSDARALRALSRSPAFTKHSAA